MQYSEDRMRRIRTVLLCAASGLIFGWGMPAYAQDADTATAEDEDLIIVTGSRIARDANLDSPTAVVTINSESIDLQGASNLADILREAPASGVSGLTGTNSNFTLASGGINTLELRNLGEDRTLILVDSKRFVSGLPGTNIVDMNYIPTALVDRVEVITGGASSIYGSDALAGVVNIILMDDFEGIETELKYGKDEFGTNEEWEAQVTIGGNFADGRGNAALHFNYVQNLGVPSNSRPDLEVDGLAGCFFFGGFEACRVRVQAPDFPTLSSFPPQGRFVVEDFGAQTSTDFTLRDGNVVEFEGAIDGFNRQAFRTVLVPVERFVFSGTADYDVFPWMTAYLQGTYASVENNTRLEPVPLESGDIFGDGTATGVPVFIPDGLGGTIPNPFMPVDIFNAAVAGGDDSVGFARRTLEVGPRGEELLRQTFRVVGGLKGDFKAFDDKTYNYDMFFNYGRTFRWQRSDSNIIVSNFAAALDIEPINPLDLGEGFQCRDELARQRGCVPINIFGEGAISPEAADFVRAIEQRTATIRQEQYGGTFTGPIPYFTLPAGDIQLAGGVEYRRESSGDQPSGIAEAGLSSSNQVSFDGGSFNVFETFGEIEVPLLRDLTFAKDLTIGAAVRYSSYNPQGETLAYSARASFQPVDELRFRFQYSRAVRAPNVAELFNTGTENFATVDDPCYNALFVNPGTAPATEANCLADPSVAARFAVDGFDLAISERQAAGGFSGIGNRDLDPEIGNSYTAGFVFDDDFGSYGNLVFSVDWFDIEIENFITEPGRQGVVDFCYIDGNPLFCSFIERDLTGQASQQGEIIAIDTAVVNGGNEPNTFLTAGVDFAFIYGFDLNNLSSGGIPSLGLEDLGSVTFNILYTYLYEFESTILDSFTDDVGTVDIFEHEILGSFTYRNGPLTFQWRTTYNDGGPLVSTGTFAPFIIDEYTKSDMHIRYTVWDGRVDLFFGIDNVLDAATDQILPGIPGNATGTNTRAEVYDPIGRSYYGGIKARF